MTDHRDHGDETDATPIKTGDAGFLPARLAGPSAWDQSLDHTPYTRQEVALLAARLALAEAIVAAARACIAQLRSSDYHPDADSLIAALEADDASKRALSDALAAYDAATGEG